MAAPRIVVVGDALLDADILGVVERVAADVAAPVVDACGERIRPGGAALAALLAAGSGADVTLVTGLGEGLSGAQVRAMLDAHAVAIAQLDSEGDVPTKRRVMASGRTLVRVDSGGLSRVQISGAARRALAAADIVLVSDYGGPIARRLRTELSRAVAPVVWDPHPRGRRPVPGTLVATPNLREAIGFSGGTRMPAEPGTLGTDVARDLTTRWRCAVALTLGSQGVVLHTGHGAPTLHPARPVTGDPCGAGDAFAAALTHSLASGAGLDTAVGEAVAFASRFVAASGDVDAMLADVPRNSTPSAPAAHPRIVATGGCFDLLHAGHVETLRAARGLGDRLVVLLNSDVSVRQLGKGAGRPVQPAADRRRVLEALECVDEVVVFDEPTPTRALRELRPAVWVKGGDYAGSELPEAPVLREWGGEVVCLPLIDGRSTTALIEAITRTGTARAHRKAAARPDRRKELS